MNTGAMSPCKFLYESRLGSLPYYLTIHHDDFLSELVINPNSVMVRERPAQFNHVPDFCSVKLEKEGGRINVRKDIGSGRPLYYHINGEGEFFCSTSVSLLARAGVKIEENLKRLPEFFAYRYVMPPETMYKDIKQVMAGGNIRLTPGENSYRVEVSDNFDFEPEGLSEKNMSGEVSRLISEAFLQMAPAKDRFLMLLSGGLDSSFLYKICSNLFGIKETCSTGFPFEDKERDFEREYALSASTAFATEHTFYSYSEQDYLGAFLEAIRAAEEPLHHLQSVLLFLLFGSAPVHKDVVISGQGADGLFGLGLHERILRNDRPLIKLLLTAGNFISIKASTGRVRNFLHGIKEIEKACQKPFSDGGHVLWSLGSYGSREWIKGYFGATDSDIIQGRYFAIEPFKMRSLPDLVSILDILGDISITQGIWSKLAEAKKRTVFYPMNCEKLIRFLFSVPWERKLVQRKGLLKEAARKEKIPSFIIERPKRGFGVKAERWARKGGVFEPLIPLCEKVFEVREILRMQSPDYEKAMIFWNILNYSIWKRLCINRESLEDLRGDLEAA